MIDRVPADRPQRLSAVSRQGGDAADAARPGHPRSCRRAPVDCSPRARSERLDPRTVSDGTARACATPPRRAPLSAFEPDARRTRLRDLSTGRRPSAAASPTRSMKAMRCRSMRIAGCAAASDQARAIGGDGFGGAAAARPTGRSCRRTLSRMACCPTRSSKASSMPARRMPAISPDLGRSTRPGMSSPPRPRARQDAVRFRRGWFLGDGTGAGKGRQVAGDHARQLAQGPPPRRVDLASPTS